MKIRERQPRDFLTAVFLVDLLLRDVFDDVRRLVEAVFDERCEPMPLC